MCGLAGYITNKNYSREAQFKFEDILVQAEVRGTDACGIAFVASKGEFYYAKAPKKASEFVKEKAYKKLLKDHDPTILIGHNRAKTQGDENNNMNNHPIVTKTGLILIHNGILHNEDDVAKKYKLKLDAEVDSEVIVKLIEYFVHVEKKSTMKAIQLACEQIRGSMAFALLNVGEPKTLYLVARDNPVNLTYHIPTKTIFFASTESILKDGLVEYNSYFRRLFYTAKSQDDYVFKEIDKGTGLKITHNNWEEFEVGEPSFTTKYQKTRKEYDAEQEEIRNERKAKFFTSTKKMKPVEIEQGSEIEIARALEDYTDFDIFARITKPSEYLSDILLYRLEYLQEIFVSGDYIHHLDDKGYELTRLRSEVARIINTLEKRQEKTKRTDLIIPEFEDIWLIENPRYKDKLESDGEISNGFKSISWILTHENPKARDMLDKAGVLDPWTDDKGEDVENGEVLDGIDDIDDDDVPPYREDYYCEVCRNIKETSNCTECGTINLATLDEEVEKEEKRHYLTSLD